MITFPNSTPRTVRRLGLQGVLIAFAFALHMQAQGQQDSSAAMDSSSFSSQAANGLGNAGQSANTVAGRAAGSGFNTGIGPTSGTGTDTGSGVAQSLGMPSSLSTGRIFAILQAQPDALVELRSEERRV